MWVLIDDDVFTIMLRGGDIQLRKALPANYHLDVFSSAGTNLALAITQAQYTTINVSKGTCIAYNKTTGLCSQKASMA